MGDGQGHARARAERQLGLCQVDYDEARRPFAGRVAPFELTRRPAGGQPLDLRGRLPHRVDRIAAAPLRTDDPKLVGRPVEPVTITKAYLAPRDEVAPKGGRPHPGERRGQ